MTSHPRFHLAFPVRDLAEARAFYGDLLGCNEGRSSDEWVDFDFFGHQIVAHLSPDEAGHKAHNVVDGEDVPVRHFGIIQGLPGEQATFFFKDPSGNALEFKAFADERMIFAK